MRKLIWQSQADRPRRRARFLAVCGYTLMFALSVSTQVYAEDMWSKAFTIMQDVYKNICLISTVAAVVTASIALLLMNFSKSDRTVSESRAWLKRIVVSWAILNSLGFILAYATQLFDGGRWAGEFGG